MLWAIIAGQATNRSREQQLTLPVFMVFDAFKCHSMNYRVHDESCSTHRSCSWSSMEHMVLIPMSCLNKVLSLILILILINVCTICTYMGMYLSYKGCRNHYCQCWLEPSSYFLHVKLYRQHHSRPLCSSSRELPGSYSPILTITIHHYTFHSSYSNLNPASPASY